MQAPTGCWAFDRVLPVRAAAARVLDPPKSGRWQGRLDRRCVDDQSQVARRMATADRDKGTRMNGRLTLTPIAVSLPLPQ